MQLSSPLDTLKKLLLSFLPPLYWLLIIIAAIYPEGTFSSAIFHGILYTLFLKIGIIIHETGHLLIGRFAGGVPKRMSVGSGHVISTVRLFGVKAMINDKLSGGYAYVAFNRQRPSALARSLFVFGGVLFNLLTALIAFLSLPKATGFQELYLNNNVLLSLILANAYLAIGNLIPFQVTVLGIRRANDGLSIYRILIGKDDFSSYNERSDMIIELADLMEDGHYHEGAMLTEDYLKVHPEDDFLKANLLICHLKSGRMIEAGELSSQLRSDIQSKSNDERALIYNILAHYSIIIGDVDQAYDLSKVAFSFNHLIRDIRVTRGFIFIEKGKYDEGIALTTPYIDLNFKEQVDLEGAIYLALAHMHMGDKKKAKRYLKYLEGNLEAMEADTKLLYERHRVVLSGIDSMLGYGELLKSRDRNQ